MVDQKTDMKTLSLLCLLSIASTLGAQEVQPAKSSSISIAGLYQRGVAEMNRGNVAAAERDFQAILKAQPQHPQALYAMNHLKSNRTRYAARTRFYQMKSIKLDRVELSDASLGESLDALATLVTQASTDRFAPNFIVKDPQKKFDAARLNLQLQNVPADQVLRYVVDHVQAKLVYEEHAILIVAP